MGKEQTYNQEWQARKQENRQHNLAVYLPFGKVGKFTKPEKWVIRRDALKPPVREVKK